MNGKRNTQSNIFMKCYTLSPKKKEKTKTNKKPKQKTKPNEKKTLEKHKTITSIVQVAGLNHMDRLHGKDILSEMALSHPETSW